MINRINNNRLNIYSRPLIGQGKVITNDTPGIRRTVLRAIKEIKYPIMTSHLKPDEDAIGSMLALSIYSKELGNYPSLFMDKSARVPRFFREIAEDEKVPLIHNITFHDGIIVMDTRDIGQLEKSVVEILYSRGKVINIDHHRDEHFIAPLPYSLLNDTVSSASELLASLIGFNDITMNMARCLLAGVLCDTRYSRRNYGKHTQNIVEELEKIAQVTQDDVYADVNELTSDEIGLIKKLVARKRFSTVLVKDQEYKVSHVVILKDEHEEESSNMRRTLADFMGSGSDKGEIVCIIYYDKTKGMYRGSLKSYIMNRYEVDFVPTAKKISDGGGHPGSVGFDLQNFDHNNQNGEIDKILKVVSDEGVLIGN